MKASNIEFLEQNYHLWEKLKNEGTLRHVDQHTAGELLRIAREEYEPKFRESTTCGACILKIFQFTFSNYDKVRSDIFKHVQDAKHQQQNTNTPNGSNRPQRNNRR